MPAILSRVAENSTGTGTGNLALGGAASADYGPNARTFAAALGGAGFNFYYDILHKTTAEYERGIGHLSGANLVRDLVIESTNSNGLVDFSAGDKFVMSAAVPDDLAYEPQNTTETTQFRRSLLGPANVATVAVTASRLYLTPYFNNKEINVSHVAVGVTTAGTGGHVARVGLFEKVSNQGFRLVYDFGTVPVDTATDKVIAFPFKLPVGCFYVGVVSQSGTFRASGNGAFNNFSGGASLNANSTIHVYTSHTTTSVFPSTISAVTAIVNASSPTVWFKTATGLFPS